VTEPTLAAAAARLPQIVDTVLALVRHESPSADVAACREMATVADRLAADWLPTPGRVEEHGGRPVWCWGPDQPRILLLGHLDTVWPAGTLATIPARADQERITGPGCFDMKAGVVQGWAALALIGRGADVGMLLTTDEEIGSAASRDVVEHRARRAAAVLVLEPSVDGALKSARKGTAWYEVHVSGRAAHAGLDPERGVNALLAAADLALACPGWAAGDTGTTVVPTMMTAGTTANTVPAEATLTIDVRSWTMAELERVDAQVRGWRPSHGHMTVTGGINRPAMEASASAGLVDLARAVAQDLGLPSLADRAVGGASDGNFTAALGVPTLDGLGAVGDGAHAEHEWVSVPALAERTALLAGLIARI
jgi:glutamate carboxypeptidase